MVEFLLPPLYGALMLSLTMMGIILPILVLYELLNQKGVFQLVGGSLVGRFTQSQGMSAGIFSLLVGVFFGLSYGAGPLIHLHQKEEIPPRMAHRIGLFLALCHALIEDPLLFTRLGGNWGWLVGGRLLFGLIMVLLGGPLLGGKERRRKGERCREGKVMLQ